MFPYLSFHYYTVINVCCTFYHSALHTCKTSYRRKEEDEDGHQTLRMSSCKKALYQRVDSLLRVLVQSTLFE